jgi:ribonucleoside-diphosphate reductase alpha chain
MAKEGSTISGFADAFAQAISYALQYGVPLQALVDKFSHVRFEPSGMTRNPEIRFAKSIVDYIFRWMASKFLSPEAQFHAGVNGRELDEPRQRPAHCDGAAEAPAAAPNRRLLPPPRRSRRFRTGRCAAVFDVRAIMIRSGACYKCVNCGNHERLRLIPVHHHGHKDTRAIGDSPLCPSGSVV